MHFYNFDSKVEAKHCGIKSLSRLTKPRLKWPGVKYHQNLVNSDVLIVFINLDLTLNLLRNTYVKFWKKLGQGPML